VVQLGTAHRAKLTKMTPRTPGRWLKQRRGDDVPDNAARYAREGGDYKRFDNSGDSAGAGRSSALKRKLPWRSGRSATSRRWTRPSRLSPKAGRRFYDWYNANLRSSEGDQRAVPSAKIMGPAATNTYFWWAQHNLEKVYEGEGNKDGTGLVDAVSIHWYPKPRRLGPAARHSAGVAQVHGFHHRSHEAYDSRPLPLFITNGTSPAAITANTRQIHEPLGTADCIGEFRIPAWRGRPTLSCITSTATGCHSDAASTTPSTLLARLLCLTMCGLLAHTCSPPPAQLIPRTS